MIKIESNADVHSARRKARNIAKEGGFSSRKYLLLELTVSELASNIIKHAESGEIIIESLEEGIKIVSKDNGPGIKDVDKVLEDSKERERGLSSVSRIMDKLDIESEEGKGTKITAELLKEGTKENKKENRDFILEKGLMRHGAISIPADGETFKGDRYIILEYDQKVFLSVIDGLGHGEEAAKSAEEIKNYLLDNYKKSLTSLLKGAHKSLKSLRGGVVGLARIDLQKSTFKSAGAGNIRIRIFGEDQKRHLFPPGTIGRNLKNVRERRLPYEKGDVVIIYSDGISSKFEVKEGKLKNQDLQESAEYILDEYGKPEDDQTVIVSRERDQE